MADLFTIENLTTLVVLTALETVLGFDNLLYISIEAKRVAPARQKYVRQVGMVLAIALRIVLLFVVLQLIAMFQEPLFGIHLPLLSRPAFNGHSLIVMAGGAFLIHTAMKEIFHMLVVHDLEHEEGQGPKHRTVATRAVLDPGHEHRVLLRHGALGRGADQELHRHGHGHRAVGHLMVALSEHVAQLPAEEPHV